MVKNKKGFLLAEFTLKVVVAVVSIVILAGLLWLLYSSFVESDEKRQAEASLNRIVENLNAVVSSGENIVFDINSPENWFVTYYSVGPGSCAGKKCLCICVDPGEREECDLKGKCEVVNQNIQLNEVKEVDGMAGGVDTDKFEIDGPINIEIIKEEERYLLVKL